MINQDKLSALISQIQLMRKETHLIISYQFSIPTKAIALKIANGPCFCPFQDVVITNKPEKHLIKREITIEQALLMLEELHEKHKKELVA